MLVLFAAVLTLLAALAATMRPGGLAWLGGARPEFLDRAVADKAAFTARGIAAIIPALFGTLAMTVALEYGQQLNLLPAAAGGAAWGAVVLFFDLAIMSADVRGGSARSRIRVTVFLTLRGSAAILAALVFSSMIALFWYRTDIATQVQRDNQAAARAYDQRYIGPRYTPQVNQAQAQAAADQERLNADAQAVASASNAANRAKLLVQCEQGGVSNIAGCPAGSGKIGSGPVTAVRIAEYQNAEVALAQAKATQQADQARLIPQIRQAQSSASAAQNAENRAETAELTFQTSHDGLLARQRALSELERSDSGVGAAVEAMKLLIIIIDCSAVIAKITSRTPSYDRVAQAETYCAISRAQQQEKFNDVQIQAEALVQRQWWQAIGQAEEARIDAWRDEACRSWGKAGQWQEEELIPIMEPGSRPRFSQPAGR